MKALTDLSVPVKLAAIESVDALVKDDAGPLTAGLMGDSLELRVRAAELLARRGDEIIIEPMRGFVLDTELKLRHPAAYLEPLRARAVGALATLGSTRTAALFADPLLKDENPAVREQAARGLCNAGHEAFLLDALSHADVAVRSWAAEGLARLGDDRGLAVLTGTLKDPHLPIREGALRALVALGPAGDNALFLGLDDADDYLSDTFFATLLARDLRAAREGNEPELLTAALSAQRPDVRYAAARALELRADVSAYTQLLIDAVSPPKPEKVGDMKDWPEEGERERAAMRLVQLLGADTPQARYSAGQALLLRRKPLEFFDEVKRVVTHSPRRRDRRARHQPARPGQHRRRGPQGLAAQALRRRVREGARFRLEGAGGAPVDRLRRVRGPAAPLEPRRDRAPRASRRGRSDDRDGGRGQPQAGLRHPRAGARARRRRRAGAQEDDGGPLEAAGGHARRGAAPRAVVRLGRRGPARARAAQRARGSGAPVVRRRPLLQRGRGAPAGLRAARAQRRARAVSTR